MRLGLLGSDEGDDAAVGDLAVVGHCVFADEENCFRAGWHSGANSLRKASELIGKGVDPDVLGGALDQVPVLLYLACEGVGDGIGFVVDCREQWLIVEDCGSVLGCMLDTARVAWLRPERIAMELGCWGSAAGWHPRW